MSLLREVQGDIISGDVVHVTELVSAFVSIANGSGAQGFQGFQGAQGFQGFQGEPGQGSQGSQGTQGFQGEPGINGGGGGTMTTVADATDFYLTAFLPTGIELFSPLAMTYDPILFGNTLVEAGLVYQRIYFCSVRLPANLTISGTLLLPITNENITPKRTYYFALYSPSRTIVAQTTTPVNTAKRNLVNKYAFDAPYTTTTAGVYTIAFTPSSATNETFAALNAGTWYGYFVTSQDNFALPSVPIGVRCGYLDYDNAGVGSPFPAITSDTIIEQNPLSIWAGLY